MELIDEISDETVFLDQCIEILEKWNPLFEMKAKATAAGRSSFLWEGRFAVRNEKIFFFSSRFRVQNGMTKIFLATNSVFSEVQAIAFRSPNWSSDI